MKFLIFLLALSCAKPNRKVEVLEQERPSDIKCVGDIVYIKIGMVKGSWQPLREVVNDDVRIITCAEYNRKIISWSEVEESIKND